jgi:hypothetical protein
MKEVVFFLEEDSAKWLLKGIVPRLVPPDIQVKYIVFNGKTDLQKNLKKKLESWQNTHAKFLVIQDRDSNDCVKPPSELKTRRLPGNREHFTRPQPRKKRKS